MTCNRLLTFADLLDRGLYNEIATRLLYDEIASGKIDETELSEDPFVALDKHPDLVVRYESLKLDSCSVAGYFREDSTPPELIVHPSKNVRRDFFTVLHEYGHYAQLASGIWQMV